MDWEAIRIITGFVILLAFGALFVILSLRSLKEWVNQPGAIKKPGLSFEISKFILALGMDESDFIDAYESNWEERLVFMKKGLITNREGIMYIPYANIASVTKEPNPQGFFITVDADVTANGCILLDVIRRGKQPLVKVTYPHMDGRQLSSLQKSIKEYGGIVVFECFETAKIAMLEGSFKRFGFSIKEVPPNPR